MTLKDKRDRKAPVLVDKGRRRSNDEMSEKIEKMDSEQLEAVKKMVLKAEAE